MARTINDALAAGLQAMEGNEIFAMVRDDLTRGFELERARAFARQRAIAAANHRNPRKTVDGLGQVTMSIDPVLRVLVERQFGRGALKDKKFVRELLRDNPELRVKTQSKAMIIRP